jgi:ABC-type transport system substrate-binding protein
MSLVARSLSMRLASLCALALFVAACGGAAQPPATPPTPAAAPKPAATAAPAAGVTSAQKSSKDTLTIGFQPNQGSLDPHFAATNQEMLVIRNIYNSLLKYKPDTTEIVGDLATSWETSPDGLTYTFKLRQDVEWQKGFGHFTASDVKGSFDRVRAPETKSPFAGSI